MSDEPYREEADAAVVAGCIDGNDAAWAALLERHGLLLEAVVMRVLDELRGGGLEQAPSCIDSVVAGLRRNQSEALRAWKNGSTFKHYLGVLTRQAATGYLQDVTPPVRVNSGLPAAAMFLDDFVEGEPAKNISKTLDRMPPQVYATVRLRLRGLDPDTIAATLGMPRKTVIAHLERVAARLSELDDSGAEAGLSVWRVVLDAATPKEHVELALRTHDDFEFRRLRDAADQAWRGTKQRAFMSLIPKGPDSLDDVTIAAFVDGTLRGADRARVEGKLTTSLRSVDTVAALVSDMRVLGPLREAAGYVRESALAAACLSTGRFRVAESLAEEALAAGASRAQGLLKLARIGQVLEGSTRPALDTSRVVPTKKQPEDDQGPIAAFDFLAHDSAADAARAIDDEAAKQTFGARLRLLAHANGVDLEGAHAAAKELSERPRTDPGLVGDAEVVLALPPGRPLPREILVERLRDAMADAVRVVLS